MIKWNSITETAYPEDGFYLVRCPNFCESEYCVAEWDNNLFSWNFEMDESIDEFVTHWAEINHPSAVGAD